MRPLLLLAAAALSLHADVTLRYKIESNPDALLPPGISDNPVLRMKGAKGATSIGRLDAVIDFDHRSVTVIDRERKTFATFPVAEFGDKAAQGKAFRAGAERVPCFPNSTPSRGRPARRRPFSEFRPKRPPRRP